MSAFHPIPLGQRIPDSLHGVSCSLPTMRAVIGYEEKHPEVLEKMTSGYPRFVQHPCLKAAATHLLKTLGLKGHSIWLTSSERAALALSNWLARPGAATIAHGGLTGVSFPENAETFARAKTFLQHTGMLLSSREAEDYLIRVGEIKTAYEEPSFEGYPAARVKGCVARAFQHAAVEDVFLANSGMNAVYAAFRTVDFFQKQKGRKVWVQLGWLYLDTIAILQKFTEQPDRDYVLLNHVIDNAAIRELFEQRGAEIAGVIAEVPTNPLIQTPDLPWLYELCRKHGAMLIVDPTISGPLNIDTLPYCDLAALSLTKFAASEGDVLAGAVVVNPQTEYSQALRARLPGELEPVYSRDIARLATEIAAFESVVAQVNRSAPAVVEFLRNHPKIKELYWSLQPGNAENYLKIARAPDAVGGMISFVVDGPIEVFYDRLKLAKGPSFGMKQTLICPFIYLAHYDLITSVSGRETLAANGLSPNLLRLSIGCEPADEIIAALKEALD